MQHQIRLSFLLILLLSFSTVEAQRHPAAVLDMQTADGGILIPGMTTAERDALPTDASSSGLLIYNSDTGRMEVFTGISWTSVVTQTSTLQDSDGDTAIRIEAANPNNILLQTAGEERMRISDGGRVGIGAQNPRTVLELGSEDVTIGEAREIVTGFETYNSGSFTYYRSNKGIHAEPSAMFNDASDSGTNSFHCHRNADAAGQDWGFGYQFASAFYITSIRFLRRAGGRNTRIGGGQIQIWRNGQLVASSATHQSPAVEWSTPYTPNVVGDEVRYIFLNGAATQEGTHVFNASEFEVNGQQFTEGSSLYVQGSSEFAGSLKFSNYGAGTLETDANGNVSVSSDERLKNIRSEFTKGLDALLEIQPIQYRWNTTSGLEPQGLYTGFSAQNVQQHLPEAVGQDARGYLTLSDRPLLAAMTNALKELHAQNEALTQQNDSLKAALEALEKRLEALEK